MHGLDTLDFRNSYARLHPAFLEVVEPTPLPDPRLVAFNPAGARLLDLDPAVAAEPGAALALSGGRRLAGSEPLAAGYAGHQFGVWVPQLGDGRAILLGEVRNARGESWDVQLKGAGRTRWSRFGDGRSVLRSAVREYLASEALHGLGIPTTRALALVGSDLPVQRETVETAATLIRLAPSHVRFGTFQFFAAQGEVARLRELAEYVIARHFVPLGARPARGGAEPVATDLADERRPCAGDGSIEDLVALFAEACRRTARLMARWIAAGFAHGVMNTDNMSILGLTLDYGPYGFLDRYDPGFICNHTDTGGRYAFDQQPMVGMWNCARLGEALMALDPEVASAAAGAPGAADAAPAQARWQEALDAYWPAFSELYASLMRAKLGLGEAREEDAPLLRDALGLLAAQGIDYPLFWRRLSSWAPERALEPRAGSVRTLFTDPGAFDAWAARYAARLELEASAPAERATRMRAVNPAFTLRNWVAQEAIERAQTGEFALVDALREVVAAPFDEHRAMARYAEPPGESARHIEVSCSS